MGIPIFKNLFCGSLQTGSVILAVLGIVGSIYIIRFSAVEVAEFENWHAEKIEYYENYYNSNGGTGLLSDIERFEESDEFIHKRTFYIVNILMIVFGIFNLLTYVISLIGAIIKMPMVLVPILILIPIDVLYRFLVTIVIGVDTVDYEKTWLAYVIIVNAPVFIAFQIFVWLVIFSFIQELKEEKTMPIQPIY